MSEKRRSGKTLLPGIILLLAAALWGIFRLSAAGAQGIPGGTNEQRVAYINACGWETGVTHSELREVRIPLEFDETYEQYNELQRRQGFDLRKYRACYAYKYTYDILNYAEPSPVPICVNLIVYDGRIIGADISSSEANGLVTVLAKK